MHINAKLSSICFEDNILTFFATFSIVSNYCKKLKFDNEQGQQIEIKQVNKNQDILLIPLTKIKSEKKLSVSLLEVVNLMVMFRKGVFILSYRIYFYFTFFQIGRTKYHKNQTLIFQLLGKKETWKIGRTVKPAIKIYLCSNNN